MKYIGEFQYLQKSIENDFAILCILRPCRQPPLTVIRAILSGQTGTSPAINRYAAKGSLHE